MTPSRVLRAWKEGGLRLVASRGMRRITAPVVEFGNVEFFVRELADAPPDAPPTDLVIEEVPATAAALLLMERPEPTEVAREVDRRFARGDRCVIARDSGGRYLHSRWVSVRPTYVPELGRCVVPAPGQAYMYDGYTRPDARGRGVDGAVRAHIFRTMRRAGYQQVVSYVRGSNTVGLKAARKWQRSIGTVSYFCLGGLGPIIAGHGALDGPLKLVPESVAAEREAARRKRASALDDWFRSWLEAPVERHSTGCSGLPDAYFDSAGRHITDALRLDPARDEVLDAGCSSGRLSREVARSCRRFMGVDLTTGLVAGIEPGSVVTADGSPAAFSVADARALPFDADSFDKVYCTGVIHMVPTHDDAVRVVDELVRVCKPGGMVLVGAVPDRAKRVAGQRLLWRRAGPGGKARLAASLLVPTGLKNALRSVLGIRSRELEFLKFDLQALRERYASRGIHGEVLDYPDGYWSEDFRTTRSNLLLKLP